MRKGSGKMERFDDFDTQIQSDEIIPEEYEDWLQSIGVTPEEFEADMKAMAELEDWIFSPWQTYKVDCDDGTHGDVIYEYVGN